MLCYVSIATFVAPSILPTQMAPKKICLLFCDNIWCFTEALIIHFCCKKCRYFYTLSIGNIASSVTHVIGMWLWKLTSSFAFINEQKIVSLFSHSVIWEKYVKFQAIKCASNLTFYRFNDFDFPKSQTFALGWESYDAIFYWNNKMFYSLGFR